MGNNTEHFDVLDERGNKIGVAKPHFEVHEKGLWHRTAHTWLVNSKKEILLQHRSKTVINSPDMWDISSAGHISAGEEGSMAAIREAKEEIGIDLDVDKLKMIGEVIYQDTHAIGLDKEFQNIYLLEDDFSIKDFKIDDNEVQDLKFVSISEFKKWVTDKKHDLVPHPEEYELLFQALKNL